MPNEPCSNLTDRAPLDRRDFLTMAGTVAAWVAAGYAPLLAAPVRPKAAAPARAKAGAPAPRAKAGAPKEAGNLPYAVRDYPAALQKYKPPKGAAGQASELTYAVRYWPDGAPPKSRLVIERQAAGKSVRHLVELTLAMGSQSVSNWTTDCDDPRQGIVAWQYKNVIGDPNGAPGSSLMIEESGKVSGKTIEINRGAYAESQPRANPLFTLWDLVDAAPDLVQKDAKTTIDLLDDGIIVRQGITLAYDGEIAVPVAGGQTLPLDSYVLYGPGLPPTHIIYDKQRLPHFIVCFMRMYALSSVA